MRRAIVAFALALAACHPHRKPGPVTTIAPGAPLPDDDDTSAPTLAEIDLSKGAPEVSAASLLAKPRATMYDLVREVDKAVRDDDVQGFFVRVGTGPVGIGQAPEIVRALKKARAAGKPVTCHADELTNGAYWTLAEGCDEVWVSPPGGLDTLGLGAELLFAAPLLAKLGVEVDILQVGKYKGTGEMFTRASASEEEKISLGGALGDMRAVWLAGITAGRKNPDLAGLVEQGPWMAPEAKAKGLVDRIGYVDEARDAARRRIGSGPTDLIYAATQQPNSDAGFVDLVRALSGARHQGKGGAPYVALVRTSGAIAMERGGGLPGTGGDSGIFARPLEKTLKHLEEDDAAKAVVLRIDSPGGSALASDLLWHALMNVRKKKPLIVSVGGMAASGGYYMAAAGTKIVAEDTSIVGSIGVVGGKLAIGPAVAQLGVNTEIVPANGSPDPRRIALESLFTPWDDASKQKVLGSMQSLYGLFVDRIAEGRGIPREQVEGFAEGRIFSGRDGKARGMVDEIGGYGRAIELARSEAKLGDEVRVRLVGDAPASLLEMLDLDGDEARAEAKREAVAELPTLPFAEELAPQAAALMPIAQGERVLATTPFAIVIK